MDTEYIISYIGLIFMMIFMSTLMIGLILAIIDYVIYNPIRADKAMNVCIERGYDEYNYYSSYMFSAEVYGVKCQNINYSRKNIDVDGAATLIVE